MITCRVATCFTSTRGCPLSVVLCPLPLTTDNGPLTIPGLRSHRFLRRNRSIAHCLKYAHRICRTAGLQDDGLANLSSVTVDQLHFPLLHSTFPMNRAHQPARRRR